MNAYPEHEKLHKVVDKSQAIGEFIDWLRNVKGIWFAQQHEHTPACGNGDDCDYKADELTPVWLHVQDILAEYFNIDRDKLEAEKRQMLTELRKDAGGSYPNSLDTDTKKA